VLGGKGVVAEEIQQPVGSRAAAPR
jgi:hypothetical protein